MANLVYSTVATASSLGPLITVTGITSYVVNQALVQAEAGVPEGMRLELRLPHLGQFAQPAANALQSQFLTGQIRDPDTGTPIMPWPEQPATLADVVETDTLRIRWVKGEWQIIVVLGIIVGALLTYLLLQTLSQSPWTLQQAQVPGARGGTAAGPFGGTPVFGGTPFRVFWIPWYDAAALALGLVAVPFIVHAVAQTERAEAELLTNRRALRAAEEEG